MAAADYGDDDNKYDDVDDDDDIGNSYVIVRNSWTLCTSLLVRRLKTRSSSSSRSTILTVRLFPLVIMNPFTIQQFL